MVNIFSTKMRFFDSFDVIRKLQSDTIAFLIITKYHK